MSDQEAPEQPRPRWRKSQQQKWYERQIAEGNCGTCGKPRSGMRSRTHCDVCLEKRKARKQGRKAVVHALSEPEPIVSSVPVSPGELDQDSDEVTGGEVPTLKPEEARELEREFDEATMGIEAVPEGGVE
jgi:hypothetical protein